MRCSTLSLMGLVALLGIGLAAPRVLADQDQEKDKRLTVHAAFGRGLNTAQAGNIVNDVILPNHIKVNQGGVVHFLVSGFHQLVVYKPGTEPGDIVVPPPPPPGGNPFINDPTNQFYLGINPAGGPLATPGTIDPSNASNRVESVSFPAAVGTGTPPSEKAEPGVYLVICNVRAHFLNGMFAFVEVKAEGEDE